MSQSKEVPASMSTAATATPTPSATTTAAAPAPAGSATTDQQKQAATSKSEAESKPETETAPPRPQPIPAIPASATGIPENAFRILITGFGPFYHYRVNPSWLAVKPLHNVIIRPDQLSSPITVEGKTIALEDNDGKSRAIHMTSIEVPMTYEAVLGTVPGLHAKPPVLPPDEPDESGETRPYVAPPANGYDVIFHVGVAGRGPLRMERLGHKLGYHMKDASGHLAGIVQAPLPKENPSGSPGPAPAASAEDNSRLLAENLERERLGMEIVSPENPTGETTTRPLRGFGTGYETFPDELMTDIDVLRLVQDLKRCGTEQIYTSMDAGHYLADYMYYCSLAESRRHVKPYEKKRCTQVLFMHCCPVGQPLSTEDVTEAIKRILVWVCNELITMANAEEEPTPGAPGGPGSVKPTPAPGKPPGPSGHNSSPPRSTTTDSKGKSDHGKPKSSEGKLK